MFELDNLPWLDSVFFEDLRSRLTMGAPAVPTAPSPAPKSSPKPTPKLEVESLSNVKIGKTRYKRRISFSPYISRGRMHEDRCARSDEVDQFIKDSCLRGYRKSGSTYMFECKKDAALAYLRFA